MLPSVIRKVLNNMNCRFCTSPLTSEFLDLVNSPASNSFLTKEQLNEPEIFYPLKLFVCDSCRLVQIDEYKKSDDIFDKNYIYFSSFSTSWVEHAKNYVDMISSRLKLNQDSFVIEIAANDGYLLQYVKENNIPCLGIEPTGSTAKVAREKGIEILEEFFSLALAKSLKKADLILGNNVLAHVPDINDFVAGLKEVLAAEGTITMEFPHLLRLIEEMQFDTVYHEHFSYFSLYTVMQIFKSQDLDIYDVDELPTHGGSLRVYAKHCSDKSKNIGQGIQKVLDDEKAYGLHSKEGYKGLQTKVTQIKYDFLEFLVNAKKEKKKIIGYGAAAKGNTFLNFCGIKNDFIDFIVDKSPHKQNHYLPASHIPVESEDNIKSFKPDYIIIFPWNIKEEIMKQLSYTRKWGCKFVVAIPEIRFL